MSHEYPNFMRNLCHFLAPLMCSGIFGSLRLSTLRRVVGVENDEFVQASENFLRYGTPSAGSHAADSEGQ